MTVLTKRLAAVAALLILAGCGQTGEAEKPAPPTPAEILKKAVPTTAADVFHYAISGGEQSASGVVDSAKKTMTTDFSEKIPDAGFTLTMKFLVVDADSWAKISFGSAPAELGLPKLPKKWMKLDTKKLGADAEKDLIYAGQTDPGFVSTLVEASTGLTEKSPGHFAGTVDLTEATEAEIVEAETLTALGEKAKAVPFEATVDAKGRISTATVRVPAAGKAKAITYRVTYDQYGTAETPAAPTGSAQVDAPKAAYDLLNS
ncbi:putative small lipoprotein YifL [Actinoplanes octamycinicus]|uniref:Putative small lipoprotein YifL n=1 Tax=Actinoplanes octamycinicus TaxID=135948 RepID=A0A7W7GW19_9ACTN|nr:hypothetical protein [Actinoplanes octamycinicus]MBB4739311.1 putative small lipoprotein YifL [Actinoplanes octamycinicus]GIE58713.1 hypothetical protein Aoc01nite_41150 [Actinoplanes octamycinicus]